MRNGNLSVDQRTFISALATLFLSLFQWALGLFGITINVWLGSFVLLGAAIAFTWTIWLLLSKVSFKLLRNIFRGITIVATAYGFYIFVLPRIRSELHPPQIVQPTQSSQGPATAPKATKSPSTHQQPEVKLTFKNSPALTPKVCSHITRIVDEYWRYLHSLGFNPPREFYPLGTRPGRHVPVAIHMSPGPGVLYDSSMTMGEENLKSDEQVRSLYSLRMFEALTKANEVDSKSGLRLAAMLVFHTYYLSSYDKKAPRTDANKWTKILWKSRTAYGPDYVDRAVFHAFTVFEDQIQYNNQDFDNVFYLAMLRGMTVEQNDGQNGLEKFNDIVRESGIKAH